MKKIILILIFCLTSCISAIAGDLIRISLLKEVDESVAKAYPKQWEVSTYSYSFTGVNGSGYKTIRYFIPAENVKHNSRIVFTDKVEGSPWEVRINGKYYYADLSISDSENRTVGDTGTLLYVDGDLYLKMD